MSLVSMQESCSSSVIIPVQKKIQKKPIKAVKKKVKKIIKKKHIEIPLVQKMITRKKIEPIVKQRQSINKEKKSTKVLVQHKSIKEKYIDVNLVKIAKILRENLYYPRRARKRGIEGEVIVKFTLNKDRTIENIIIISSDKDILSRAAYKTLEGLSGSFPKPTEKITITFPVRYSLRNK